MEKSANNVLRYLKTAVMPKVQKAFGTEVKATYESASFRNYVVMGLVFDLGEDFDRIPFASLGTRQKAFLESAAEVLTRKSGLRFTVKDSGWIVSW